MTGVAVGKGGGVPNRVEAVVPCVFCEKVENWLWKLWWDMSVDGPPFEAMREWGVEGEGEGMLAWARARPGW